MTMQQKRLVRVVIAIGVILTVLLTAHFLVNSLDLPSVLRSFHGG
jgi:hypothetical protein